MSCPCEAPRDDHADLISQSGDHVDAVVHVLTAILGEPRALAALDTAGLHELMAYDGAPTLT
jgi:hypothetical protein